LGELERTLSRRVFGQPATGHPYCRATLVGNFLFVSGHSSYERKTGQMVKGDITVQTKTTLDNLSLTLKEAGFALHDVVKATVYLKSMDDYRKMNGVYASYFSESPHARTPVETALPSKDLLIEIELIAYKSQNAAVATTPLDHSITCEG
jgi:2-iminobutanoate/2-iminopropanoate deaminase